MMKQVALFRHSRQNKALNLKGSVHQFELEVGHQKELCRSWLLELMKKEASLFDAVIGLSLFKGNMTDPLGSWSFLADKEHGSLKAFSERIEPIFKKIILSESEAEKSELLNHLHIMTLKEKMLVPLWIEPMYFIYSSRITPARSNPFDLRIRFFELDMNETK